MTARKIKESITKGFTLVELLIVIGLLGVIALIVIAAINPIEQANRARDTRFKADGAQLISAIDRYFVTMTELPWVTTGAAANNEASYGFISAGDQGVGICGTDCSVDGVLIVNDELKSEFRNRDFIKDHTGTDDSKKIFIGKKTGTSESVYACFIPAAKTSREKSCTDGDVYTISSLDGTRTAVDPTLCADPVADWGVNGWYICLPQ